MKPSEKWATRSLDHGHETSPVVKRRNKRQLDKTRAKLLELARPKPDMEAAGVR